MGQNDFHAGDALPGQNRRSPVQRVPVIMIRYNKLAAFLFQGSIVVFLFLSSSYSGTAQSGPAQHSPGEPARFTMELSSIDNATVYGISSGDCAVKWIVYRNELNRGVIKHSSQCSWPLGQQLPLLSRLCEEVLGTDQDAQTFRTLFWGGLVPERKPLSLELSLRLALAAYRSPSWDARRGRPVHGDLNRFVKDLANSQPIYPELKTVFGRFHRSITLAGVEKVRVLKARDLPFYDELRKEGVQAGDKLPFDCMAWFSVSLDGTGRANQGEDSHLIVN